MGSQLQMVTVPAFVDIADATYSPNNVLTDTAIQALTRNAKFGATRLETIFMGFWKAGDVIALPVSPVDGYTYGTSEVIYDFELYSTRGPGAGFVSGQLTVPPIASTQSGNLFWWTVDVDLSRIVRLAIAYADGTGSVGDGIVKVFAVGQRNTALSMALSPVYLDIPDDVFAVAQPLKTGNAAGKFGITDLSHNAKFGAVRKETFYRGFWSAGSTVTPPISAIDGYQYAVSECIFRGLFYSNLKQAGGFSNGEMSGSLLTVSVNAGGTGYAVNDLLVLFGVGQGVQGIVKVSAIGGGGAVTAVTIPQGGYGYSAAGGVLTAALPTSTGTGCTINILTVGVTPTLTNGQLSRDGAGQGPLYWWTMDIDHTGIMSSFISYFVQGGAETVKTNSGVMKVLAIAQRGSSN